MSGVRGTITDSDWTDDDARVVCRTLGHFRPGNAHAHILPRACQPMRKQRSCARDTDCARSQTSYETARMAEAILPTNDESYTSFW